MEAILVLGPLAGWLLATSIRIVQRELLERRLARPGELVVSAWPLAPGREVTFALSRVVRQGDPTAHLAARLVLRSDLGRQGWADVRDLPLPAPDARLEGDRLTASWRYTVPLDAAPPRRGFLGIPKATGRFRWELRVAMPVEGDQALDSTFYLAYAHPAGGSS